MDIFGEVVLKLNDYKEEEHLFSEMLNSTCCVEGVFSNVTFHEQDFTEYLDPLYAEPGDGRDNIVLVDSNWGRYMKEGYVGTVARVKSNRGRKPKPKTKKNRKVQGNGSKFNSCIQFSVLCDAESIGKGKEYKIKVFRNGKFQVPGILTEDMSDTIQPLTDLAMYLDAYFLDPVEVCNLKSYMRNYKFRLLSGNIDIRGLYQFCLSQFTNLKNICPNDITKFLIRPIFDDASMHHPRDRPWSTVINLTDMTNIADSRFQIDVGELMGDLLNSNTQIKNVLVNIQKVRAMFTETFNQNIASLYAKFIRYMKILDNNYVELSQSSMEKILELILKKSTDVIINDIVKDEDNLLAGIRYNPEKYPGLLIYVKTPIPKKKSKRTTVKIFNSGKVNIDGANNAKEAEFIYWWLNHILVESPKLMYNSDYIHNETDDEFSESDEESAVDVTTSVITMS
jgi:hypothetical protein